MIARSWARMFHTVLFLLSLAPATLPAQERRQPAVSEAPDSKRSPDHANETGRAPGAANPVAPAKPASQASPEDAQKSKERDANAKQAACLAEADDRAKALLESSHELSLELPAKARGELLSRMLSAASHQVPALTLPWAKELLALSAEMDDGLPRQQMQASAVIAVAQVDPKQALALLDQVDPPAPDVEDARAAAADAVFSRLMNTRSMRREGGSPRGAKIQDDDSPAARPTGAAAVTSELRGKASQLAQTGDYPYRAMGQVVRALLREDPPEAEAAFLEALIAFRQSTNRARAAQAFATYVRDLWAHVPRRSATVAVQELAAVLIQLPRTYDSSMRPVGASDGSLRSTNQPDMLLSLLMPALRSLDPQLAQKVSEQRPAVPQLATMSPGAAFQQSQGALGDSRSSTLPSAGPGRGNSRPTFARRNTEESMALIGAMPDPGDRAIGYSRMAGRLFRTQPEQARALLAQALSETDRIDDPLDRLQALSNLSGVALMMNDSTVASIVRKAFDVGEVAFAQERRDHPQRPIRDLASPRALGRIAGSATLRAPEQTEDALNTLRDSELQGNVLVSMVEALRFRGRGVCDAKEPVAGQD